MRFFLNTVDVVIGQKPNYFHSDAVQIKNSQNTNLDRRDVAVVVDVDVRVIVIGLF